MKENKALRIQCVDCGRLNIIQMKVAAARGEPIRCKKCSRTLVVRE